MKSFEMTPPILSRSTLFAATFAICLFGAETSVAKDPGKDMNEFLPPQASTAAVNRPIGIDDIAKASANATSPQEPAWRSGIIDSGLAPFPAALYKFENQWHEILNGAHVKVYAGSLGQDPSQGVIVIQTISLDNRSAGAPRVVKVPGELGSLRIIAAEGNFLTLRSSQGVELTLNAATGQLSIP